MPHLCARACTCVGERDAALRIYFKGLVQEHQEDFRCVAAILKRDVKPYPRLVAAVHGGCIISQEGKWCMMTVYVFVSISPRIDGKIVDVAGFSKVWLVGALSHSLSSLFSVYVRHTCFFRLFCCARGYGA